MADEDLPVISAEFAKFINKPYGGLFGDAVVVHVIQAVVADPTREYRPKDLEEFTGASNNSVKNALNTLVGLKLLIKDSRDSRRPVYRVNLMSRKLIALTFLAFAVLDDREDTDCMDDAIVEYCISDLKHRMEPYLAESEAHITVMPEMSAQVAYGYFTNPVPYPRAVTTTEA